MKLDGVDFAGYTAGVFRGLDLHPLVHAKSSARQPIGSNDCF